MSLRTILSFILATITVVLSAQKRTDSSVLSEGVWHKVSVETSGMHFIGNDMLRKMGFNDPSSVRLYGSGGGQLSFIAGDDKRDDLYPLPTVATAQGLLFYAEGPTTWRVRIDGSHIPVFNYYTKKAYYYLTMGGDNAPMPTAAIPEGEATEIASYDARAFHALRSTNLDKAGRDWVGEQYTISKNKAEIEVNLPSMVDSALFICGRIATKLTFQPQPIEIGYDDQKIFTRQIPKTEGYIKTYTPIDFYAEGSSIGSKVGKATIKMTFANGNETIWLNYISVNTKAPLTMNGGNELLFRNYVQEESSVPVCFKLSGVDSKTIVWDVTDATAIKKVQSNTEGGIMTFTAMGGMMHEYVAFDPQSTSYRQVQDEGAVANQNVHAHQSANYLIITTPAYAPYAERLARLHERTQGLSWRITYVDEIYEEFSAGRPEAPALRNYIKMLYERGLNTDKELQYVLLLGSGSYDNFDRSRAENVIPTYESSVSYGLVDTYATDDFYCWLKDGDGQNDIVSKVCIGLGRLPVASTEEAETIVGKIERYEEKPTMGSWRQKALFIGGGGDENEHARYADRQAANLENLMPDMVVQRVFSESYARLTASTGFTYPQAVEEVSNVMQGGCSLIHYTGHGNITAVGDGYFNSALMERLTNGDKLFFMVAASCTVAPYDQHRPSVVDKGLYNRNGGMVGVFAANREVYGNLNYNITRPFVSYLYGTGKEGRRNTAGYAMMMSKIEGPRNINSLKFHLLGDPAMQISVASDYYAQIDTVCGKSLDDGVEPLKALGNSHFTGSIHRADGTPATDFDGKAAITLYDKKSEKKTSGVTSGTTYTYSEWSTKLYSGEVDVRAGQFEASFVLSKEFDLSVGYGRVTIYASTDDNREAMGSCEQILVGGFEASATTDTVGPSIEAWIDYERDAAGNIVNRDPILYTVIDDPQGINVSGQGIGHNISLMIDGNRPDAISLNSFFSYESGSSTRGMVVYPLHKLADSGHLFTIKAWDNLNNSNSVSLRVDAKSEEVWIDAETQLRGGMLISGLRTDAVGESVELRIRLFSSSGSLITDNTRSMTPRNGDERITLYTGAGALDTGIYVVRYDITDQTGRKGSLAKKIFVGAQ